MDIRNILLFFAIILVVIQVLIRVVGGSFKRAPFFLSLILQIPSLAPHNHMLLLLNFRSYFLPVFCLLFFSSHAFCQQTDSLQAPAKTTTIKYVKSIAIPVAAIGYGISVMGDNGFYSSKDAQQDLQARFPNFHTKADDYMALSPGIAVYALHFAGIEGENSLADKTILAAASGALTGVIVLSLKETTNVLRPDNSTYNSLPSGHTAYAFTAAEFMHQEYKNKSVWYSVAGYTVAAATGTMRMLNNRHWMSDVLIGAGIGMLSVKTTYAVYPLVKNKIYKNRNAIFIPGYNQEKFNFAFVYRF